MCVDQSAPVPWKPRSMLIAVAVVILVSPAANAGTATENLLFVTIDGLRWEEVFSGVDKKLIVKSTGVESPKATQDRFWRDTPEARRETLLPFFWATVAKEGSVFGDPGSGSKSHLNNPYLVSYPGYNEILTGRVDLSVRGNVRRVNPNISVLEWLNQLPAYQNRIAAFASWDLLNYILPQARSGVYMNAGWEARIDMGDPEGTALLNEVKDETPRVWSATRFDIYTFYGALEYLKQHQPRVLYVALGEPDDWGHSKRYDHYLDSAQRNDADIRRLGESMQSMAQYAGKTTLIITPDHGRGGTVEDWTNHSSRTPGAENTWWAIMGPDSPRAGIVKNTPTAQDQLASTIAAVLGEDFHSAFPTSGKVVEKALKPAARKR